MSIYKRKDTGRWQAIVRVKGFPMISECFDRKEAAEDWKADTKKAIKNGIFNSKAHREQPAFSDLIARMRADGILSRMRSSKSA